MNQIFGAEYLKIVTNQINDWKYEPVKGIGVFSKAERYAHIEISIHTTDYYTDKIEWSITEESIPNDFHQEISNVLMFFSNYLTALKGRREKNLVFEVIDGSFNNDSGRHAFTYATVKSLVGCFDKKIFEVTPSQLERILFAKNNGLETIRHWAKFFSENQIIESLQDEDLTSQIKKTLSEEDFQKLKSIVQLTQAQEITAGKFLDNEAFIEKNIITKYGHLTDIGLTHIAVIVKNKAVFSYVGVFSLAPIEDKLRN